VASAGSTIRDLIRPIGCLKNKPTSEDGIDLRDLIAVHVQIFFHTYRDFQDRRSGDIFQEISTRNICIVYVTAVQVIAKVADIQIQSLRFEMGYASWKLTQDSKT
jgi:hypothetical protein